MIHPVLHECYDLTAHQTLKLTSTCRYFYPAKKTSDIPKIVQFAKKNNKPIIPIGSGSNVIFREYLDAVVMPLQMEGITLKTESSSHPYGLITVKAGHNWHALVQWALKNKLYGLENLSLIPGTIGAAPIQNIGAYGEELSHYLYQIKGYQPSQEAWLTLNPTDCQFQYRDSIFKHALRNDFIITEVTLKLNRIFKPNLNYPALKEYLLNQHAEHDLTAQLMSEAVCKIRTRKIPDPIKTPNVGSFFKNPMITKAIADHVLEVAPETVLHAISSNQFKVSAGWLIEHCGLKGYQQGPIAVHKDHALILTNLGASTSAELLQVGAWIADQVYLKFKISLEIEPTLYPDYLIA